MRESRVRFDMFAWQVVPWSILRDDVRYLETLDIGTVWLGDAYAMPAGYDEGAVLDAWTTLGALAGCTERVRLGTMVTNVSLRHPAMLAKQAATVDRISGGRLDLGVGAGTDLPEDRTALGLPALSPGGRVDRLHEAVEVIDQLLRGRHVTYHGDYYRLDDALVTPTPVQQPRPPLIIGGNGRRALRVVAEHADVWVSDLPWRTMDETVEAIRERNRLLDEYCRDANRDPVTVERACIAGWSPAGSAFASRDAFQDFVGRYREAGVQRFVFSFGSASTPAPYDAWIDAGRWATRKSLEAFAAQEMNALQGAAR